MSSINVYEEAFLLSKNPFQEKQQIIEYLTETSGKLKSVLRGVNDPTKKTFFPEQPGDLFTVSFHYNPQREWTPITLIEHQNNARKTYSPLKFGFNVFLLECIRKIHFDPESGERLFKILCEQRQHNWQNGSSKNLQHILRTFRYFSQETGFRLRWESCILCGMVSYLEKEGVTSFRKMEWSFNSEGYGLVCQNCRKKPGDDTFSAWFVKLCFLTEKNSFREESNIEIPIKYLRQTCTIVIKGFIRHLDLRILSQVFLFNEINRNGS